MISKTGTAGLVVAAVVLAGCGGDSGSSGSASTPSSTSSASTPAASSAPVRTATHTPAVNPAATVNPTDFSGTVDNPYFPLVPGTRWLFKGITPDGRETNVVTVTHRSKRILGVRTVVVHDTVSRGGRLAEDTFDWYAQDRAGNVWYMGEDTKEYENGKVVSTEGSWQAGVRGAKPGIVMLAHPKPGQRYRQEYRKGVAEDRGRVLSIDEQVGVPAGHFRGAVMTRDTTPLEKDVNEYKLYAKGVGVVLELSVSGGWERNQLVRVMRP